MLKLEEIRQMNLSERNKEIARLQQELLKTKLLTNSGQSKETSQLKTLRKTIARLKTINKESQKN